MTSHVGKIKEHNKFDVTFFGMVDQMAEVIDPQARMLVESSYEAIIDAGKLCYLLFM